MYESQDVYGNVFHNLLQRLRDRVYTNKKERDRDKFEFIPNTDSRLTRKLITAYELSSDRSFLDVGCGFGNIMAIAEAVGFSVRGIEYNEDYRASCLVNPSQIYWEDALNFDDYASFGVIYFYCPFRDHKMELKLEATIVQKMHKGSILIPYNPDFTSSEKDSGEKTRLTIKSQLEKVSSTLYRKI